MQDLYIAPAMKLTVIRSFSSGPNGLLIHETADGAFVYPDGKPVINRGHLSHIPEPYLTKANKWFDKTYGKNKDKVEYNEPTHAKPFDFELGPSAKLPLKEGEEYPK